MAADRGAADGGSGGHPLPARSEARQAAGGQPDRRRPVRGDRSRLGTGRQSAGRAKPGAIVGAAHRTPGFPRTAMDELDRNLERQMRSQERQLMAVRLTLAALAAVVLVAFRETLPSAPVLLALVGAVVIYSLALWWLSGHFPTREVAIVGT